MSVYSFKITKGRYQLSLTTTDKELVVDQFARWVRQASEYVQKHKVQQCKEIVKSQINAEQEITQKKIDEQLKRMPKSEPVEDLQAEDTKKNLDIFYAPADNNEDFKTTVTPTPPPVETVSGFDSILEKSIQSPQTELSFKPSPSIKKDNAFINFISAKPIEKKIDYLLMTAYYFTQYEQKPRFTLKQLNAKLMQNIAVIIDHSVLQEAINRDYIECLPDLTGLVGASEYRLTAYGEKVLLDA
jgi:hypothetical protein